MAKHQKLEFISTTITVCSYEACEETTKLGSRSRIASRRLRS
jgi:hypothetical protein